MSLFIKVFSLHNPIKFLAILYRKLLADLVAEMGTRHNYQILFSIKTMILYSQLTHQGINQYWYNVMKGYYNIKIQNNRRQMLNNKQLNTGKGKISNAC